MYIKVNVRLDCWLNFMMTEMLSFFYLYKRYTGGVYCFVGDKRKVCFSRNLAKDIQKRSC